MHTLLLALNKSLERNMKNSDDDKKKKLDKKNNSDNKNNTSTDSSNQGAVSGQKPTTLDYFKYFCIATTRITHERQLELPIFR